MSSPWVPLALFLAALVAMVINILRHPNASRRQKTVNMAITVMCIGGIGATLPSAFGITSPEVRSTATVFSVCCTLVGFFFLLRHRNA
jgi:cation transport ATPase